MVAGKTCRLSGINKDLMYRDQQPSSNRDLFISGGIARRKRNFQFAGYFFCLLLSLGKASGQTHYETRLAEAVNAQSAGDISGAIVSYQRALAVRRDVPEVWANLGLMQHQAGDYSGALSSFKTAYQLQPKLFVPLLFLGIENLQLNNRTDAVHYLSMARQLHPDDPEIYMNLGRAYFGLKQFENASVAYRRATQLNPKNGEPWYRLGIAYLEMSEAASGDLAAMNRQSPFFQRLEAESLSEQDKLAESAETFRKLLAGQNFPPCSRSSSGLVLLRRRELFEAQSEFQQEQKLGGCSLAELGLVRIALEKGETEAALKSLATLWALDSGFMRAHIFELARGMTPEQIKAFDLALASADVAGLPPEAITVLQLSLRGARTQSVQNVQSDNATPGKPAVPKS